MNAAAPSLGELYERALAISRSLQSTRWCPHDPFPKQAEFLALDCREALYGGQAAGGKSDALLMGALQGVGVPGYAAILFRRTFAELALADALMDRSHQWLDNTKAHWDGDLRQWRFPLPDHVYGVGAPSLSFGYIDCEKDKLRYQSAAFQYVGFDELTHFPEAWYRYLLSRLRRGWKGRKPIMRGASNPGNLGHEWVKARFIDPGRKGCAFVSAGRRDNPFIDHESYEEFLSELDEVTRRQLMDGDWDADGKGLVYSYSPKLVDIDALPARGAWSWLLSLDFGVTDENAATVLGWRDHDPVTYIAESYRFQGEPSAAAEEVEKLQKHYRFAKIVGDMGGLGKGFSEEMIRRWHIPIEAADKHNKLGFIRLMNGALERGLIKAVTDTCDDLLSEWKSLPRSAKDGKEAKGFPNHAADSALYGWRMSRSFLAKPLQEKPRRGTEAHEREEEERLAEEADEGTGRRRAGRMLRSALRGR